MAIPILLVALGGSITYHAGIINVAMEGLMLAAAFAAVVFSYLTGSALVGVLAAIVAAILFSIFYSFFVTTLETNNFAMGFALNIFISSFTLYLSRILFIGENAFNSPKIASVPRVSINFGLKILNDLFSNFSVLVYLAILLVVVVSYIIKKTPFGLWLRAAGSQPDALNKSGKRVTRIQYFASIITGILCGLSGAQLSLSNVVMFSKDMSGGRGFIALAIILISNGKPSTTLFLALFFGLLDGLSIQLQSTDIPAQFLFMLPYLMAIITLIIMSIKQTKQKNGKVSE
jgi:simple sugar transport system permease protein